jgi:hypothetical protein
MNKGKETREIVLRATISDFQTHHGFQNYNKYNASHTAADYPAPSDSLLSTYVNQFWYLLEPDTSKYVKVHLVNKP